MKNFSLLSLLIVVLGICACISCGYLLSTALVATNLFQHTAVVASEEQTVYGVSLANSTEKEELASKIIPLQAQNGAGYVFEQNGKFFLVSSIYENLNDAELVKNNLQASGTECEVVSIGLSTISVEGNFSNDEKNILTNCLKAKMDIFKKLYDVSISLDTNLLDETKAKLECNSIYSFAVTTKANFDTCFGTQTNNVSLNNLQQLLEKTNTTLENLINENYDNDNQTFSSLIKLSYCQILLD